MATALGSARRTWRALAALMVAVVAVGGLLLVGGPAGAASKKKDVKVADATMAWAFSNYVLNASPATLSVSEVHAAEPPATFTDGTGWTFSDGTGKFNPKTGAMSIAFPGALEFGNTNRGNYAFKFANPTFALDAKGSGTLTVDLSIRPSGATAFNPATKVVVLDITGTSPTKTKNHVEVTATPAAFTAALTTAATDLAGHFQATGSPSDANKPPAPITVEFDYKIKKK